MIQREDQPVSQAQHSEVLEALQDLRTIQGRIEQRITDHMLHEHKDFDELVDAWRSVRGSAKIFVWVLGIISAVVTAVAGIFTWIKLNFHVIPK